MSEPELDDETIFVARDEGKEIGLFINGRDHQVDQVVEAAAALLHCIAQMRGCATGQVLAEVGIVLANRGEVNVVRLEGLGQGEKQDVN